jgi:hypothetical protein
LKPPRNSERLVFKEADKWGGVETNPVRRTYEADLGGSILENLAT